MAAELGYLARSQTGVKNRGQQTSPNTGVNHLSEIKGEKYEETTTAAI